MKDPNCAYCGNDEALAAFGYPICEMDNALLYEFKEQSNKGRVILASKEHHDDITEMSDEERTGFFADMAKVAKVLHKLFKPDKINYAAFGDTGHHCHFHLVPKYKGNDEFGGMFAMNSGKLMLDDEACEELAEQIRSAL
ncbi:MAG TPA: HIT family protein [Clostridiaceae bacterium]|nr:HIT family protein [Clostridiaceae bacterium]